MRQVVDRSQQSVPDPIDVQFVATQDGKQVAFTLFHQLDQPVLHLDVTVRAGFAGLAASARAGAVVVQASQKGE
jgi:hypothetical protein